MPSAAACTPSGFNEAAAYHCGKPVMRPQPEHRSLDASMRPQHITAENGHITGTHSLEARGFNEAAAYHCGKPSPRQRPSLANPPLQ